MIEGPRDGDPGLKMQVQHGQEQVLGDAQDMQQAPLRTEFLDHLDKAGQFYEATRDSFMARYPFPRTQYIVVWGRTGVGKRLAISQLIHKTKKDPVLNDWLREGGHELDIKYIAFAESANLAKLEGNINPNAKHGTYNEKEYREASKVNSRFVLQEANNFEGPRWVFVEATGPAAQIDFQDGRLRGPDRALSTVSLLGQHFERQTRLLVINRPPELIEKVVKTRQKIEGASPDELPDILKEARLQLARGGDLVDLRKLSLQDLTALQHEFVESMASWKGVIRSNGETDELKALRGGGDEEYFWGSLLHDLGFNPNHYEIANNPPTDQVLTIHQDELNKYDPVLQYAQWLEQLGGTPKLPDVSQVTFSDVAKTAGRWLRRDFSRLPFSPRS